MLEDSQEDTEMIIAVLQQAKLQFRHQRVETKDQFTQAIGSFRPDIVLSDNGLPGFNSIDALKICVRQRTGIPFILVSGALSDELVNCLKHGADNYVLKSNLSRLPDIIHNTLEKKNVRGKPDLVHASWIVKAWWRIIRAFWKPKSEFKINQAVRHFSGGPLMVVSGFNYHANQLLVVCQWYDRDENATMKQAFPEHELEHFDWNNPDKD